MKTILKNLKSRNHFANSLLLALIIKSSSCKKAEPETIKEHEQIPVIFAYEVNCEYCNITYIDASNQTKTINNNNGNWSYKFEKKIAFDLKLSITTVLSSYQTIQAYILKDQDVVYGNIGYNRADISYNTISANGTSSFGSYVSTNPVVGSSSGSTTNPISYLCGAKNKTGGYCKRVVVGGGRCWQHK